MATSKNITDTAIKLYKKNKMQSAYNNILQSVLTSNYKNSLSGKQQSNRVSTAAVKATANNETVAKIFTVKTGEQNVLSAVDSVVAQYPSYFDALTDIQRRSSNQITTGNFHPLEYKEVLVEDDDSSFTYVASDPDKPTLSAAATASYNTHTGFNVNDLYNDTNNINPWQTNYRNKNDGQQIPVGDILSYSDKGIVLKNSEGSDTELPSYKFLPDGQIVVDSDITDETVQQVTQVTFKDKIFGQEILHTRETKSNIPVSRETRYRYLYMFSNMVLENRVVNKVAGCSSELINVGDCDYFELSATITENVEYTVVEGNVETPILPKSLSYVTDEKLFFGLAPRFTIAEPDNIVVKRDNVAMSIKTKKDLELFLSANTTTTDVPFSKDHNFTISYKPAESAKRYFPKNDTVRIRIVQRCNNGIPQTIPPVKILKYNSKTSWYLSSYEQDIHHNPNNPVIKWR